MIHPKDLSIEGFDYDLPPDRIPSFPIAQRDHSRLLVYTDGKISDTRFFNLKDWLNEDHFLVMNDTRVIPARLIFRKSTGGVVEIFCLEPLTGTHEQAMASMGEVTWKCMVGGAKKWKEGPLEMTLNVQGKDVSLVAEKMSQENDVFNIRFSWQGSGCSFSEILSIAGVIPLPPYFHREASPEDHDRYQTVFARQEGSVAAPTAALHFTTELLEQLKKKGVDQFKITLHVGAGTFKPVSSATMEGHDMHAEVFSVPVSFLKLLRTSQRRPVAVGTTTTRTLESLYWLGVKIHEGLLKPGDDLYLGQWECYDLSATISLDAALGVLIDYCEAAVQTHLSGATSLLIAPGFTYRICKGVITNFHMPKSTLILLVAALSGSDWRRIYSYALEHEFRFLSYGDSSLLLP
jgi:S-adenosylmethionine:tRNA ribosyltransferase-isomerase